MNQESLLQDMTQDEILHLVRKLRWIGMESDAEGLQRALHDVQSHASILSEPADTD